MTRPVAFAALAVTLAPASILAQGIVTTAAASIPAACSFSGDGGPATQATLCSASGAAVDGFGNIYFADSANFRIRKIATNGTIATIAGNGTFGNAGDGGPALLASIGNVYQVAVSMTGRVCFGDSWAHKLRCVNQNTGLMEGYGSGQPVNTGDGGPFPAAGMRDPAGIAFVERTFGISVTEDIYISDTADGIVRRIDGATGIISTVAGPGVAGIVGDGGPATSAYLHWPTGLFVRRGFPALFVAEETRVRRIDLNTLTIATAAGNGVGNNLPSGDGGPATAADLRPSWLTGDDAGNLFIAANNVVRRVDGVTGIMTTIAGQPGLSGISFDDVHSTSMMFPGLRGLGWDAVSKRLLITELNSIRQIFYTPATSTALTVTPSGTVAPGASVTLQAAVTPANATGSVRFYQQGLLLGAAPLVGGAATFNWTATPVGAFGMRAVYGGDALNNLSASASVPLTVALASTATALVSSLNPSVQGGLVTFTATVAPAAAGGSVEFKDGAAVLGTVSISGGVAAIGTSALTPGSHSITARYLGNSQYSASVSPALTQVVKTPAAVTLSSSPNPSTYGGSVTLTATVAPVGATGTIQFVANGSVLGTVTVVGGSAQLTTSSLPGGVNSLSANYSGDANYASGAAPATHTVNKRATATTLTASPSNPRVGNTVVFTARVTPVAATGTVVFRNGTTQIGTGTLSNGVATFSTAALPRGTHSIRAEYQGNGNYNGSQSAVLSLRVR